MTYQELKKKFFKYFQDKKHKLISPASLIPENDPTVLFTTAGMHPLVPYLLGEKHPEGKRLVNVQKCLRTGDMAEVGDNIHHTFFEMLGNWSLGDYFKKETIGYSLEFLLKELKLDKNKIAISVFGGNKDVSREDKESEKHWREAGIVPERIIPLADNWWGPAGQTGPCGPDTEIFYWTGAEPTPAKFDDQDSRWVEIWNDVFMEYNKTSSDQFEPLKQKNIDTGMGLERTLAVLNGFDDNYLTELFQPIIKKIEELSGKKYNEDKKSFRIVADHIRSAVFVLGDEQGIAPSNKDQGYVLRRLIRRAIVFGNKLGLKDFTKTLAEIIIKQYQKEYPELKHNKNFILEEINKEENRFTKTLVAGLKEFAKLEKENKLDEVSIFGLSATYGLPMEVAMELAKEKGKILDEAKIKKEFLKHQELSRTASAGLFKGGLADASEVSKKYHTATHLLQQALRDILGSHVQQKGSNINAERLRFDFIHPQKMTTEELKKVEDLVNHKIKDSLVINCQEMSPEQAKKKGAIGLFTQKYGEKIKVYSVANYSREICGGPHVNNTSELGHFKIIKEEASSAGVRRIKAILE
jgi:alanyl-tRNA synthetase